MAEACETVPSVLWVTVGEVEISMRFPMATSPERSVDPRLSRDTRSDWSPLATDLRGKGNNRGQSSFEDSSNIVSEVHLKVAVILRAGFVRG